MHYFVGMDCMEDIGVYGYDFRTGNVWLLRLGVKDVLRRSRTVLSAVVYQGRRTRSLKPSISDLE